jgi:hypothetical protein
MRARILWICLLSPLALGQATSTQTAPATMTKLVVRLQRPDIPEPSFAAQPKTMYRAGSRYCRIEELPDPEHGIHGLVVINEPDFWMVNRLDRTAQHGVDPGPTFNCSLPMFVDDKDAKSAADTSNPLKGLEFGRELAFFHEKGAASAPGPTLSGKATNAYTVKIGDSQLVLFTSGRPERPVAVARERKAMREVYWYGSYDEVAFDAKLFAKPEGVKIEDAH